MEKILERITAVCRTRFMKGLAGLNVDQLIAYAIACALWCGSLTVAYAVDSSVIPTEMKAPNSKSFITGFFTDRVVKPFTGSVVAIDEAKEPTIDEEELKKKKEEEQQKEDQKRAKDEREKALGRTSREAPDEFLDIVYGLRSGKKELAQNAADRYVDYLMNLMFEVREISSMIMKSLVKKGAIKEDDTVGVGQYLNLMFAEARDKTFSPIKPTHSEAMKRVNPDSEGQAQIYYFFTVTCSSCRAMAPDLERLWQVVKGDPKLKMVALTMQPESKVFVESYRKYTGLTAPIYEGAHVAKQFKVAFVPALVVVSPNQKIAYLSSGQQTFQEMYEFVRKVQGVPVEINPQIETLMKTPIGDVEHRKNKQGLTLVADKSVQEGANKNAQQPNRF